MRVALTGIKGDFVKGSGSGIVRYNTELYDNLIRRKLDVGILEFRNLFQYTLKTGLNDLSGYDIIHNPVGIKVTIPFRKGKAKMVNTVHDLIFIKNPELYNERTKVKDSLSVSLRKKLLLDYSKISIWSDIKFSDHIITDAALVKNELVEMGLSRNTVSVVPLGVDKRFIKKAASKKNKIFTVGYIGSFQRKKNVGFAIEAFNKFQKIYAKGSIMELWGSPKSPEYEYTRSLAANNKNIIFKGFAPEEMIVQTYDRFHVAVFPIISTGFELEILEAQSRGIPVITCKDSKIPSEVRKYCLESKNAEHAAEIIKNLAENGYNEKAAKIAMRYARTFTWDRTAEETIKVYNKIIED